MFHVGVLTTDFRVSSMRMRDTLYFEKDRLAGFINGMPAETPVREIVVLCTCNRIEIYYVAEDTAAAAVWLIQCLADFHQIPETLVRSALVNHCCANAVRHIFRVASGVESMVFGEHEILGQIRDAYFFSRKHAKTNSCLNRLFQQAIATGKKVRHLTGAAKGSISVSSIAIEELLDNNNGNVDNVTILIVGLGTMGLRALKRIVQCKPKNISVCNRDDKRAVMISRRFNAQHLPYSEFRSGISDYDCVILATSSNEYILSPEQLLQYTKQGKQLLVIDIGAPRNADPEIGVIDGVKLICVDDLKATAERHLSERTHEIGDCEAIIEEQVAEFTRWYLFRKECTCSE
ncbi:MAG: glutamyl-tRNA reductase [Fibrobacter sp.]|nr:glutamyl-tRNA reductase [Fibrobacter sp.]